MAAKAGVKKSSTKSKLAAAKKKVAAPKTAAKKTAAKKTTSSKLAAAKKKVAAPKKTVAKKPTAAAKAKPAAKRKKAIGFEVMASHQTKINKDYEAMQKLFDSAAEKLVEFLYDGKKVASTEARSIFQEISKSCKTLRASIQEAKTKLKPIYKAD